MIEFRALARSSAPSIYIALGPGSASPSVVAAPVALA
jgi:hypothetical protein